MTSNIIKLFQKDVTYDVFYDGEFRLSCTNFSGSIDTYKKNLENAFNVSVTIKERE